MDSRIKKGNYVQMYSFCLTERKKQRHDSRTGRGGGFSAGGAWARMCGRILRETSRCCRSSPQQSLRLFFSPRPLHNLPFLVVLLLFHTTLWQVTRKITSRPPAYRPSPFSPPPSLVQACPGAPLRLRFGNRGTGRGRGKGCPAVTDTVVWASDPEGARAAVWPFLR